MARVYAMLDDHQLLALEEKGREKSSLLISPPFHDVFSISNICSRATENTGHAQA